MGILLKFLIFLGVSSVSVFSLQSSAQNMSVLLDDGVFLSTKGYCSVRIFQDTSQNEMLVAYVNTAGLPCADAGTILTFHNSANRFLNNDDVTVVQDDVDKCQPTADVKTPCDDWFYNPKSGALMLKAGDVRRSTTEIIPLNPDAFKILGLQEWLRGTTSLHKTKAATTDLFYRAQNRSR